MLKCGKRAGVDKSQSRVCRVVDFILTLARGIGYLTAVHFVGETRFGEWGEEEDGLRVGNSGVEKSKYRYISLDLVVRCVVEQGFGGLFTSRLKFGTSTYRPHIQPKPISPTTTSAESYRGSTLHSIALLCSDTVSSYHLPMLCKGYKEWCQ
jgi:hypothetical protein